MVKYICIQWTPYSNFTLGKEYKAYKDVHFDDIWIVIDDIGNKWTFTEYDSFTGFHRYFKSIKEIRKEKLQKINECYIS